MKGKTPNEAKMAELMKRLRALRQHPDDVIRPSGITLRLSGVISALGPISAGRVESALKAYPEAPLEIEIDSVGGSVTEAEKIVAAIDRHRGLKVGTVVGRCCSGAIAILLACKFRQANRSATFLIHRPEASPRRDVGTRWTAARHKAIAAELDKITESLVSEYARRTGRPASKFKAEILTETGLSAISAMKLGLIEAFTDQVEWKHGRPFAWPDNRMLRTPAALLNGRPWSLPRNGRIFC